MECEGFVYDDNININTLKDKYLKKEYVTCINCSFNDNNNNLFIKYINWIYCLMNENNIFIEYTVVTAVYNILKENE